MWRYFSPIKQATWQSQLTPSLHNITNECGQSTGTKTFSVKCALHAYAHNLYTEASILWSCLCGGMVGGNDTLPARTHKTQEWIINSKWEQIFIIYIYIIWVSNKHSARMESILEPAKFEASKNRFVYYSLSYCQPQLMRCLIAACAQWQTIDNCLSLDTSCKRLIGWNQGLL